MATTRDTTPTRGINENGAKVSTRDHIISTAAALFAANGYAATGISEILEASGISRGTLYYHVDSKEMLLFEISRIQVRRMTEVATEILASDQGPVDKVRTLARSLLRNISDHDAEWIVFFREFNALEGERRQEILDARALYESMWLRTLEEGMQSGDFVEISSLHVKGILGMLNYTYLWIDPNGTLGAEQIADLFVDMLLTGLLKRPTHIH